jgi:uncharacterized protein (DUF427 family)
MTQVLAPFRPFDATQGHFLVFEESPRRVRAFLGGVPVADSTRMMLLHESMRLPVYYFPFEDVRADLLEESDRSEEDEHKGPATFWHVRSGGTVARDAAFAYRTPAEGAPDLSGHVAFAWDAMDAWFEEDDQVYRHARDPYHRVDVLSSSRHVRVSVDGETVAETTRPRLVFETGLPTRYYIPKLDVRTELLTPTDKETICPYKGTASYWSLTVGGRTLENIAWSYRHPIVECPKIENLVAFFNEKIDIDVDGVREARPRTQWS